MDFSKNFWILVLVFLLLSGLYNFIYPGKLPKVPGDISIDKENFRLYIPWVSSLIMTLLASLALNQFFH